MTSNESNTENIKANSKQNLSKLHGADKLCKKITYTEKARTNLVIAI